MGKKFKELLTISAQLTRIVDLLVEIRDRLPAPEPRYRATSGVITVTVPTGGCYDGCEFPTHYVGDQVACIKCGRMAEFQKIVYESDR